MADKKRKSSYSDINKKYDLTKEDLLEIIELGNDI